MGKEAGETDMTDFIIFILVWAGVTGLVGTAFAVASLYSGGKFDD